MNCEQDTQIHRYHDGDLSPAERASIEAHLAACAECQALLADLEKLSEMFATVPFADMTTRAHNRMEGAWWAAAKQAQDRSVRRFASWLTAAAAAVLVFIPLAKPTPSIQVQQAGLWADTLALIPPNELRDTSNSDLVEVALWMANDVGVE